MERGATIKTLTDNIIRYILKKNCNIYINEKSKDRLSFFKFKNIE